MSYVVNVVWDAVDGRFELADENTGSLPDGFDNYLDAAAFGMDGAISSLIGYSDNENVNILFNIDGTGFTDPAGYVVVGGMDAGDNLFELVTAMGGMGVVGEASFYIDLASFNLDFDLEVGMTWRFNQGGSAPDTGDRIQIARVTEITYAGNTIYVDEFRDVDGKLIDQNANGFGQFSLELDPPGGSYEVTYLGADGVTTYTISITSSDTSSILEVNFICFQKGTMISTENGQVAVEDLAVGDRVLTNTGEQRELKWIASRKLSALELIYNPSLRPIRVSAGALSEGTPDHDLWLSPQHRILLSGSDISLFFGVDEALAPIVGLKNDSSIVTDYEINDVEYFHLMFEQHEVIYANGVEAESFFPGDTGMDSLDKKVLEELLTLFPDLEISPSKYGPAANLVLRRYEVEVIRDRILQGHST